MVDTRVKNTNKHPTILIINGVDPLGIEISRSLLEQGAYVVFVDLFTEKNWREVASHFGDQMVSFHGYDHINFFTEDLRRLDYVFYLEYRHSEENLGTQEFLHRSNMLDSVLEVTSKFGAKFNLVDSIGLSYAQLESQAQLVNDKPYSHVEWQRYAENMVIEYVKKGELDARVTRLGEVIGEGMDLSIDSDLQKMLIEVAREGQISLPGDGLDTEYYTHLLDAAYGVIKSIFTEETQGEVCHVAYENPITNLSLAYRLQELEPQITKIDFNKDALSSNSTIKMKRIAPNLSNYGWRPRIDLDQALSEALVVIKTTDLAAIQHSPVHSQKGGILSNLKNMLGAKNPQSEQPAQETTGGPVNRLIAERRNENARKAKSMADVESKFAKTRKKRNLSLAERLQNSMWNTLQAGGQYFKFLQKMSPQQVLVSLFLIAIGTYFYFNIFSPALVLTRNIYLSWENIQQIKSSEETSDYSKITKLVEYLSASASENRTALITLRFNLRIIQAEQWIEPFITVNDIYLQLFSGADDVSYAIQPFNQLLDSFNGGLRYRVDSENYLAASSGINNSRLLDLVNDRDEYFNLGSEGITDGIAKLRAARVPSLGENINEYVREFNNDLIRIFTDYETYSDAVFQLANIASPESTGVSLILVDDSQITPVGGRPASVGLFQLENGAISAASLKSIDTYSINQTDFADYLVDRVKLYDPNLNSNISFLGLVNEYEYWQDINDVLVTQNSEVADVDTTVIMSMEVLDYWYQQQTEGIVVNGQQLQGTNLYAAVNSLNGAESIATRNSALTQVLGQYINENWNNLPQVLRSEFLAYKDFVAQGDILIFGEDYNDNQFRNTDIWVEPFALADTRLISQNTESIVSQNVEISVTDSQNALVDVTVDFSGIDNLSQMGLCIPITAIDVQVAGLNAFDYKSSQNLDAKCISSSKLDQKSLKISWIQPIFVKNDNDQYNLEIGLAKPKGLSLFTSAEISLASNFNVEEVSPREIAVDNKFDFEKDQVADEILYIKFTE